MSDEISKAKTVIRDYYAAFDAAAPEDRIAALTEFAAPEYRWRGLHPFHEQHGVEAAITSFWAPYLAAFSAPQRREDIFLAGWNDCDGGATLWTCSMGHLRGLFDAPFLGLTAHRRMALLPYAEFHRIEAGRIAETALFVDILRLTGQTGQRLLPPQTAADLPNPPPRTHDGVLLGAESAQEGAATLALVNQMAADISTANAALQGKSAPVFTSPEDELRRCWHEDMGWYGPTGIGATYTIERYIAQHQSPFRRQLADRVFHGHVARIAEGSYCAFFGWPNLSVTPIGGYLGMPATKDPAPMRVCDVYRRDGDKLAENWIFIDILHWLNCQGLDVLARARAG